LEKLASNLIPVELKSFVMNGALVEHEDIIRLSDQSHRSAANSSAHNLGLGKDDHVLSSARLHSDSRVYRQVRIAGKIIDGSRRLRISNRSNRTFVRGSIGRRAQSNIGATSKISNCGAIGREGGPSLLERRIVLGTNGCKDGMRVHVANGVLINWSLDQRLCLLGGMFDGIVVNNGSDVRNEALWCAHRINIVGAASEAQKDGLELN